MISVYNFPSNKIIHPAKRNKKLQKCGTFVSEQYILLKKLCIITFFLFSYLLFVILLFYFATIQITRTFICINNITYFNISKNTMIIRTNLIDDTTSDSLTKTSCLFLFKSSKILYTSIGHTFSTH